MKINCKRSLSLTELSQFSNCEKYVEKFGKLINTETKLNLTGNLIKSMEVPISETFCTRRKLGRTLNIHVPFLSWFDAKRACDKFHVGSIVGPFEVIEM